MRKSTGGAQAISALFLFMFVALGAILIINPLDEEPPRNLSQQYSGKTIKRIEEGHREMTIFFSDGSNIVIHSYKNGGLSVK